MTTNGWMQIFVFLALILAITKPLGVFMARVFSRERTFLDPLLRPVERLLYRVTGVNEEREMRWTEYAVSMLLFSGASMLLLYLIERVQGLHWMPWNPQHFTGVEPRLAFNTAASFTTNTNWQNYGGESTMSYFTQMAGLAYHNFVSAAAGIALAIAVIRGIARKESKTLGNFSLNVEGGQFTDSEIIVMLGENGTGKSTLVRMLAGALKPDNDQPIPKMAVSMKPQKISPKFQGDVRTLFLKKVCR